MVVKDKLDFYAKKNNGSLERDTYVAFMERATSNASLNVSLNLRE